MIKFKLTLTMKTLACLSPLLHTIARSPQVLDIPLNDVINTSGGCSYGNFTLQTEGAVEFKTGQSSKSSKSSKPIKWRTGRTVFRTVYENDQLMFLCTTPEDATRIVELLNLASEIENK